MVGKVFAVVLAIAVAFVTGLFFGVGTILGAYGTYCLIIREKKVDRLGSILQRPRG